MLLVLAFLGIAIARIMHEVPNLAEGLSSRVFLIPVPISRIQSVQARVVAACEGVRLTQQFAENFE